MEAFCQTWRPVFDRVLDAVNAANNELFAEFPVIAGGAVRDALLEKPLKDIDVWIPSDTVSVEEVMKALNVSVARNLAPEFGTPTGGVELSSSDYDGLAASIVHCYEFITPLSEVPVQCIWMRRGDMMFRDLVLRKFDFGICQAAYDDDLVLSRAFMRDVGDRTFTALKPMTEREQRRWARISQKYPGYTLVNPFN